MKKITAALFGGLALVLASSSALAQSNVADFTMNQAVQQLSLDDKEFQTIYRTEQVPSTCYRDEVRGSRNECRTETRRQCHFENRRVCENVPRRTCSPVQQCTTRIDRVCNSSGCRNVPRRSCVTVNQCTTRVDQVCRTAREQVCRNVPEQICRSVPVIARVPYSCTRPVQVPAGQQLKLHTVAHVSIQFANMNEVGPTGDVLRASLKKGIVTFASAGRPSAFLYQVVNQQRSEQSISSTEKVVNYQVAIRAVSIQKLNEFLNSQLSDARLLKDQVEFTLLGRMDVPVKGHLKLAKNRRVLASTIVVDADFGANALVTQGNRSHLMLNALRVRSLDRNAQYTVELSLGLDLDAVKSGLINPESLSQIANRSVQIRFESVPN